MLFSGLAMQQNETLSYRVASSMEHRSAWFLLTIVVGFTIMAFAPMPMFASYGILTAVMIFLAAAASLLVLPSILLLVTPARVSEA